MTKSLQEALRRAAGDEAAPVDVDALLRRGQALGRRRIWARAGAAVVLLGVATVVAVPQFERPRAVVLDAPDVADAASATPSTSSASSANERRQVSSRWRLLQISPDEHLIALVVPYGGCEAYGGLDVDEGSDRVQINARLSVPATGDLPCVGVAYSQREVVRLDEPLGDRELGGCGGVCEAIVDHQLDTGANRELGIADEVAVVNTTDAIVALAMSNGAVRWQLPQDPDAPLLRYPVGVGSAVVVLDEGTYTWVGLDPATGHERWRGGALPPYQAPHSFAAGDVVLALTGDFRNTDAVQALDAATGSPRWTATLADDQVGYMAAANDVAIVLSGQLWEGQSDGGHTTVSAFELATGELRWAVPLAGGPYGAVMKHGVVVVQVYGGLYGLDLATGAELWRRAPFNSGFERDGGDRVVVRYGAAPGVEIGIDPRTGEELADSGTDLDGRNLPVVDGHVVVPLDDGRLLLRDASAPLGGDDSATVWAVDTQAALGMPDADERTIVIPTPLGANAYDTADGSLRWAWTGSQ